MPRTNLGQMHCSIARTFGALGDGWSALILRDLFVGIRRFDALVEDLGISRKVLSERLEHLEEQGLVTSIAYQASPPRREYQLAAAGRDLVPALLALLAWGDRWKSQRHGPPALIEHKGHQARAEVVCDVCGEKLEARDVVALAGPGGRRARGTRLMGAQLGRS